MFLSIQRLKRVFSERPPDQPTQVLDETREAFPDAACEAHFYADDGWFASTHPEACGHFFDAVSRGAKEIGLELNPSKSVLLHPPLQPGEGWDEPPPGVEHRPPQQTARMPKDVSTPRLARVGGAYIAAKWVPNEQAAKEIVEATLEYTRDAIEKVRAISRFADPQHAVMVSRMCGAWSRLEHISTCARVSRTISSDDMDKLLRIGEEADYFVLQTALRYANTALDLIRPGGHRRPSR